MPYKSVNDLPKSVRSALKNVPHAQKIFKEAYNSAHAQYADRSERRSGRTREETAHAVAWSAVKKDYKKDAEGVWHPKR